MNRLATGAFCLLCMVLGGLYAWPILRSEMGGGIEPELVTIEGTTSHLVTPEMADASRAMVERLAPPFEATATDDKPYRLVDENRRGPVVLTFIKDGCPCSKAAQPFFNRLHAAYPEVGYFGVIDVEAEKAKRWAGKQHVTYPVLLDPGYRIIRPYEVENSAYVVVIDAEGRILKHWPGYSAAMLKELSATLAQLIGAAERPIDVADAPEDEYSGCPFDL